MAVAGGVFNTKRPARAALAVVAVAVKAAAGRIMRQRRHVAMVTLRAREAV